MVGNIAAGGPEQILYNCKMCGTSYCNHNNLRLYPYVLWCPVMARGQRGRRGRRGRGGGGAEGEEGKEG